MTASLPSMNPADPPPFHQLDEIAFQEMCRDILEREEGIATCEIYGVPGQGQNGIDLKAAARSNTHIEVAQCKCWQQLPVSEIEKASEKFFTHIEFWRKKKVKRFILMVASPLDTTQQQESIDAQIIRFAKAKITYEPWSSRTLRTKLKDHRDIVFRYTRSAEWVEAICGPAIDNGQTSVSISGQVSIMESIVLAQLPIYSTGLSKEIAERVERIKEEYRKGQGRQAYDELLSLEEDATWSVLEASLKARILRQRAAYRLDCFVDPAGARALVDQAHNLDPDGDDTVIRALIKFYTEGSKQALELLGEPTNTATLNARLAFLLEWERSHEALDQIQNSRGIIKDVETHRLHALALLAEGQVDQARTTIQAALSAEPDFEFVRFSAAVIDYFSCLASASLPSRLVQWPEPPSWALIKSDDLSRERLRQAEQAFAILCRNTDRGENWLRIVETWRLACIANDSARQDEARDFCRDLLARDSNHYRAFLWAQVRGLNIDFDSSELSLRQFASSDADLGTRLQAVSTLMNFYLLVGKTPEASAILKEYRTQLERVGAQRNLKLWDLQLMMAQSQAQSAIDHARNERDEELRRSLMLIALRNEAESSTNWKPYLRYLEKKYRRSKRGDYLFELCSVHAELGEWHFAAEHAKELIETVQSPAAVRLSASALWHLKKKDKCLKLLNSSMRYFPGKTLPGDLARMRVDCQIATGALVEAVVDAGELLRREGSTQNLVALMQAQLSSGDLKGMAISARDLMSREDVEPDTLVRAVGWVHFEDSELATHLWRRAVSLDFSDPTLLGALIEAGFRLGLDDEVAPLFKRAQDSSEEGRGPLQSVSVEEFISANRERAQQVAELQRDYERGLYPLHVLTNSFNRTLVDLLHGLPEHSSKSFDPLRQARIYIRHGRRAINNQFAEASSSWRLCLDVSSVILAAHLGILELIEREFKPVLISPRLITALLSQQQNLQTIAPKQIRMCTAILELIEKNKIKLAVPASDGNVTGVDIEGLVGTMGNAWVSSVRQARADGGYLVDHLPLTSHMPPFNRLILPRELDPLVIGCRTVVHNLSRHGWISPQLIEETNASTPSSDEPVLDIPEHASLYFYGNIVESLQELGALETACEHYEVHIDGLYVDYAKRITESSKYLSTLTSWLRQLIDRIRTGLTRGVYECIPAGDAEGDEPQNESGFEDTATTRELLSRNLPVGSVLCFDDRHINSYLKSETAPIIGINEVIAALRHRSVLSEAQYYENLLHLRAGNYRYIPVKSKEILWHIEKAPIIDEELQETPELRILRRYIAACFLDNDRLQIVPPLPGSNEFPGEAPFILGTKRALDEALVLVWRSEPKAAEARANYLLKNMYTGSFGIRHLLPNPENRGDATFLLGLDLAGMVTTGFLSLGNPLRQDSRARQRLFLDWYTSRVMLPRLTADPETAGIAGSTISNFILHSASETYRNENDRHVSGLINHVLFTELPKEVKDLVKLPSDIMEWIGHKLVQTVSVGDNDIEKDEFAFAVEKLLSDEAQVSVKDIKEAEEFELRRVADDHGVPAIEIYKQSQIDSAEPLFRIKDPFLQLCSPVYEERKKVILGNRYWFDCDKSTFESQVLSIASVDDAARRMDQVQTWRSRSAEVYYRELKAKLARTNEFHLSDLIPPSAEGFLSHFRLPTEQSIDPVNFPSVWERSARELVTDEDLPTALDRITVFPIKTSKCLTEALAGLPSDESYQLVEALAKRCLSPLGKLHLADIAIRVGGVSEDFAALTRGAVSALYEEEAISQLNLLEAFLKFVHEQFFQWRETAGWSDATRLALTWAHSTRLQQIFNSLNADPIKLVGILDAFTGSQSASEVFYRDGTFIDVLHYHRFSREVFLTHGVAAVLGGHGPKIARKLDLKTRIDLTAFDEKARKTLMPLLRDPELMTNVTGSFLGGDHQAALSPVMENDTEGVSSLNLKILVSSTLEKLASNPNTLEWANIDLVVGDRPMHADLSERLRDLVDGLDLVRLYQEDDTAALLAVRVATEQMIYWDDDAFRMRVEESLLKLLQFGSKELDTPKKNSRDARVGALIDAALKLSLKLNDPRESSKRFSQLLHKMRKVFPALTDYLGPGFVNLMFQVPAAQLHGMWPFLLTIRATSDKAL